MGLRTIHLKLHNPSTVKRDIINAAFINYNNAFNYLLKNAYENIASIERDYQSPRGTYSSLTLSKWIDRGLSDDINKFDIQPFKDSLKLDIGMVLASYFVQKKTNPNMPFPSFKADDAAGQLKFRPIYFCRYDVKRCFCFLYDAANNKYFAKIFLMNSKNAKVRFNNTFNRELQYISKKQPEVKGLKKETFIIVPLSFGKWQEGMLRQAVDKPEILRTSRLIMKGNEYFISLSIDLPEDEKIKPATYLGISRGIKNALNYTVADMDGEIIDSGAIGLEELSLSKDLKTNNCILANKIAEIAINNKSVVVLQNLVEKGDKLSWNEDGINYKPIFGCKRYNDLVRILEYKIPQRGLPAPVKVSSVDIFSRCRLCGSNTKKNRFSKNMFICTTCGASYDIDGLGSSNLAVKLIKYQRTPLKIKARKTEKGMLLQNELIGLNLIVPFNENPFDKLMAEVKRISEGVCYDADKADSKDVSSINGLNSIYTANTMINKLVKHNFTNIEII
ncbi:putative transposase [Ruminiclostridium sufflavum DSM 19573]|uniref:Putative transposase n=1 Tax=Ruminiclostridium sufflavum DSM 19573 TaxID=1121337 RepID=A0A318Y319_9FIRM|nr:zinc ribbon domain-containing protein [Ruminiclostridium sufflavum]PYG85866.1 putative transposase [Ruminiclostridium sufflavum DSM 19573]